MTRHKVSPQPPPKRLFVCAYPGCKAAFPRLYTLRSHFMLQHKVGEGPCPICHKNVRNLRPHVARMRDLAHKKFFACYSSVNQTKELKAKVKSYVDLITIVIDEKEANGIQSVIAEH